MANVASVKEVCCGCHGCAQICPKQCIKMIAGAEGFFYPQIDTQQCVDCGLCAKACPVMNAEPDDLEKRPDAWAVINKDEAVRLESSSGGVFTLLAEQVINCGGVVFGAAWTKDFRSVRHIPVESAEELPRLRGSKYVQSRMEDCYLQAKKALEAGRRVLFSGTPCQVEGLKTFLGKAHEKLLCVDIICHGVPAPAVWEKYLAECEKEAGAPVSDVRFRCKEPGWKDYTVKLLFQNGTEQMTPVSENPYMRAFLQNACLRPSCYACRFKKKNRESDLTLADFWGIEEVCPDMDDDRGTSLVLVHTHAGRVALEEIQEDLRKEAVDVDAALKENPAAMLPPHPHENREAFLKSLECMPLQEAVKRWLPQRTGWKATAYRILKQTGMLETVKKILGKK